MDTEHSPESGVRITNSDFSFSANCSLKFASSLVLTAQRNCLSMLWLIHQRFLKPSDFSRSQALLADRISALQKAIQTAETSHMSKSNVTKLKRMAPSLAKDASTAKSPSD